MPEWRLAAHGQQKHPKKAKAAGTIELLVPPNGAPGATIRAESSAGPIDVQIPAGAGPHSFFEVQDPSHGKVTVRFEVPATVAAGELVRVPRPGGELVSVRVPPGAKPGEWAAVQLGANYAPANALTDEVSPAHVSLTERFKGNPCCGDSDVSDLNQHKGGCFCVDTCCGIPCFCLKTNRQRAALVLGKFEAAPVNRAQPGDAVAALEACAPHLKPGALVVLAIKLTQPAKSTALNDKRAAPYIERLRPLLENVEAHHLVASRTRERTVVGRWRGS